MADESVLVYETEAPIQMTCTSATGIERGAHLTLSDPMTAAAVTSSVAAFAGVCHREHAANDGNKVSVYMGGVFRGTCSGAVTVGKSIVFENGGKIMEAGATSVYYAGYALETGADGETILYRLQPTHTLLA